MRLTAEERKTIKTIADVYFGEECVVRLFGSRVDDTRRGGDIDLHVEPEVAEQATFEREIAFRAALQEALGDQRIDVVIRPPGNPRRPIDRIAVSEGIML